MLFCKGRGCQYRKTCSRYVLGRGVQRCQSTISVPVADSWIDHCINAKKFDKYIPIHGTEASQQPTNQ